MLQQLELGFQQMKQHRLSINDKKILKEIKGLDYNSIMKNADKNQVPFLKHVFRLNELIFGEVCNYCPTKIIGYIQKLKQYDLKMIKAEKREDLKFKLKSGKVVRLGGKPYSEHNVTDKVSLAFLRLNPNRKQLFKTLPDNVDDLINKEVVESIKLFGKELTFEKVNELLSEIGVKSKASAIKGIQKKIDSLDEDQMSKLNLLINPVEPGVEGVSEEE